MLSVPRPKTAALRLAVLLALIATLAGCGSGLGSDDDARAEVSDAPAGCAQTVMATLGSVLQRVYNEGVRSERTASAAHLIEHSLPLRRAIEAGDAERPEAPPRELLATGHMTNLDVKTSTGTVVSVGGAALAPLQGTITGAAGKPIATYTTSVWADRGFSSEGSGIAEALVAIRAGRPLARRHARSARRPAARRAGR